MVAILRLLRAPHVFLICTLLVSAGLACSPPAGLGICNDPFPTVSDGQGLMAFVATSGIVHVWDGEYARPVYRPSEGYAVVELSLSPDRARPYLAVLESTVTGAPAHPRPIKVYVVNLGTGASYQALPLGGGVPVESPGEVGLQWSADGTELVVSGSSPAVLSIGTDRAELAWDLTGIVPEGAFMRSPLMAPDFSRLAFTLFDSEGVEDLWAVDRPADGSSFSPSSKCRMTTGNQAGYPVRWLGARGDGSEPEGSQVHVLVRLGGVSTGGGVCTGLGVVNTGNKELDVWYPEGPTVYQPVAIDLAGGNALVSSSQWATGQDGRVFWRALREGRADIPVQSLDGLRMGPGVLLDDGATLAPTMRPADGEREYWLVKPDGSVLRLGSTTREEDGRFLDGTIGGRTFLLTTVVAKDSSATCRLMRVNLDQRRLDRVSLVPME